MLMLTLRLPPRERRLLLLEVRAMLLLVHHHVGPSRMRRLLLVGHMTAVLLVGRCLLLVLMHATADGTAATRTELMTATLGHHSTLLTLATPCRCATVEGMVREAAVLLLRHVRSMLRLMMMVLVVHVLKRVLCVMMVVVVAIAAAAKHPTATASLWSLRMRFALQGELHTEGVGLRWNGVLLVEGVDGRLCHGLRFVAHPSASLGATLVVAHNLHFEDRTIGLEQRHQHVFCAYRRHLTHEQLAAVCYLGLLLGWGTWASGGALQCRLLLL